MSVRKEADYTNTFVGCRNPMPMSFSPNGSTAAMYDRATHHSLISLQIDNRATMAEKIFRSVMAGNAGKTLTRGIFATQQRAIMEYCGIMAFYGIALPDITLFSDIAPLAVAKIASQHPAIQNQLRNIGKIKTRIYAEVISNAAKYALMSAIGLAGRKFGPQRKEYVYRTEEVVLEMQRYAYCDMETLIFVMSEAMYDMTDSDFHGIAQQFAIQAAHYKPFGTDKRDRRENLHYWPVHVDQDRPPEGAAEQVAGLLQQRSMANYSLERFLDVLLGTRQKSGKRANDGIGRDYLSLPKLNAKTGDVKSQRYQLREYRPSSEEHHLHTLLEDFRQLAELNDVPSDRQPRLEREVTETTYMQHMLSSGEILINFNYIQVMGDFSSFSASFGERLGDFLISSDGVKDLLYRMRRMTMITPYIPTIPKGHGLEQRVGDIQSLRYSPQAMREFKHYKVPVLIPDTKCFYLLTAFCETNPHVVIRNMISSMTYNATRSFNCLIGIPAQNNRLVYDQVQVRPEPGKELHVARRSNIDERQFKRIQAQFNLTEESVDGYKDNSSTYKEIDIEAERAMQHLRRCFPTESDEELVNYTPRGIERRFYAPGGFYYAEKGQESPYTIPYTEEQEATRDDFESRPQFNEEPEPELEPDYFQSLFKPRTLDTDDGYDFGDIEELISNQ